VKLSLLIQKLLEIQHAEDSDDLDAPEYYDRDVVIIYETYARIDLSEIVYNKFSGEVEIVAKLNAYDE
jgi:hypothetical protein